MQINFGSLKLCKSTKPVPDITCHLDSFGEPVKLALGRCHQTRIKVLLVFLREAIQTNKNSDYIDQYFNKITIGNVIWVSTVCNSKFFTLR